MLIVGANSVARMLAQALIAERAGDRHRQQLGILPPGAHGRHSGLLWPRLPEHAENYLDLSNIAQVLALSPNRHQNALAVYHFGHLFGEDHVFAIRSGHR